MSDLTRRTQPNLQGAIDAEGQVPTADRSPEVTIRPAEKEDLETIRAWTRHYFGGDRDKSKEWIWRTNADPSCASAFSAVATVHDVIVGAGAVQQNVPGALSAGYPHLAPYEFRGDAGVQDVDGFEGPPTMVGWFSFLAVDDAWRGQGIGKALAERRLEWCREKGIATAAGISWRRENHPDSAPVFESAGFRPVTTYEDMYSELDDRKYCPDCGDVCDCSGTLYVKDIRGERDAV